MEKILDRFKMGEMNVLVDLKKEYMGFMTILEREGLKWHSGDLPTKFKLKETGLTRKDKVYIYVDKDYDRLLWNNIEWDIKVSITFEQFKKEYARDKYDASVVAVCSSLFPKPLDERRIKDMFTEEEIKKHNEEFKVGDKVRCICDNEPCLYIKNGHIYTIKSIDDKGYIKLEEIKEQHNYKKSRFEKLDIIKEFKFTSTKQKQFTKGDLKQRNLVKLRDGREFAVGVKYSFGEGTISLGELLEGRTTGVFIDICDYTYELEHMKDSNLDIVEVWKPEYKKIWEGNKLKEKSISKEELTKKLGYEVDKITLPNGEWVSLKED